MTWDDIVVSSKIQGHISAGIYRSAGGALKELVSNAFDADATRVTLTTNWPSFDIVTCRDNGVGITPEQFHSIMRGGIGDSSKRLEEDKTPIFGRPIVGRLGIGMLGIAQICHEFQIISHCRAEDPGSGSAFKAVVKLADYLHEKMDGVVPEEHSNEILENVQNPSINRGVTNGNGDPIEVGKFSIETIPFDSSQIGTYIVATDMRSAFVKKFRQNPGPPLPMKIEAFLNTIGKQKSIRELGDYWQMIWEMAISCPITYSPNGPFNRQQLTLLAESNENSIQQSKKENSKSDSDFFIDRVKDLTSFEFDLVVDGLPLRKPNLYPSPDENKKKPVTGTVFFIHKDLKVAGRPLKLTGYIYLQDGLAIVPMELRGILIRIRNVAIGKYDPTFLDYPKIEGPRYNWLSGELYIEEGLEHALNIDRDSFNQMHPHYVRLQEIVHELLPEVFSKADANSRKRSRQKKQIEQDEKRESLEILLEEELGNKYSLIKTTDIDDPIVIDTKEGQILINVDSPLWPRSSIRRDMAHMIAIAFEASMQEPKANRKKRFYQLLAKILYL